MPSHPIRSVVRKTIPSLSLLVLLLLLLPLLPGTLSAAETADPRQEVLAADARRFAAMVQGDLAALENLLTEDLTYTHSSGKVETRTEILESLRSGRLRYLAAEPSESAVRLHGETAIVTGRADLRVSAQGGELTLPVRFTEVWVKSSGVWKLAAWQSTRIGP
jgi:ketosteroid isomerase-like protein